jgi:dihydrofolate reductase
MKTQYYTAASLDGFIATEDHSLDWLFPLGKLEDTGYAEFFREVGALAMGASTYEWMLRHVVKLGGTGGAPWPYAQPTWVFTHRELPRIDAADVRFACGDVRPVHASMRGAANGRNLWLVGGGDLVGQFFDAELLDEIIVTVGSVTLGKGQPLLPRRIVTPSLVLESVRHIGPGFVELHYRVPRRPA